MDINIKHEQNFIVELIGRLDTTTAPILDAKLKEEKIEEQIVVLDFSLVEYISSAGLRSLLALKKNLDAQNKKLEIHNINDVVKEVFNVTGFINILTIK